MDTPQSTKSQKKPTVDSIARIAVEDGDHLVRKNQLVSILAWLHPEMSAQEISSAFDRIES